MDEKEELIKATFMVRVPIGDVTQENCTLCVAAKEHENDPNGYSVEHQADGSDLCPRCYAESAMVVALGSGDGVRVISVDVRSEGIACYKWESCRKPKDHEPSCESMPCRCGVQVDECTAGCRLWACCGGYVNEGHMSNCRFPVDRVLHGVAAS